MTAQKTEQLERILTRAAEQLGDVTEATMEHFYAHFPGARAIFERHGYGDPRYLEEMMVSHSLFCVMEWLPRQSWVDSLLWFSVSNHERSLGVTTEWYSGLVSSVSAVLLSYCEDDSERHVVAEIQSGIRSMIYSRSSVAEAPSST
jgi:hypothetical protein